jgi:hypothetical protein
MARRQGALNPVLSKPWATLLKATLLSVGLHPTKTGSDSLRRWLPQGGRDDQRLMLATDGYYRLGGDKTGPRVRADLLGDYLLTHDPRAGDFPSQDIGWDRNVRAWMDGKHVPTADLVWRFLRALERNFCLGFIAVGYFQHAAVLLDALVSRLGHDADRKSSSKRTAGRAKTGRDPQIVASSENEARLFKTTESLTALLLWHSFPMSFEQGSDHRAMMANLDHFEARQAAGLWLAAPDAAFGAAHSPRSTQRQPDGEFSVRYGKSAAQVFELLDRAKIDVWGDGRIVAPVNVRKILQPEFRAIARMTTFEDLRDGLEFWPEPAVREACALLARNLLLRLGLPDAYQPETCSAIISSLGASG